MLGFAKGFIIALFASVIVGIGTESWENGLVIIGAFIVIKIIWGILSWKNEIDNNCSYDLGRISSHLVVVKSKEGSKRIK